MVDSQTKIIANNIRKLLKEHRMTQSELANRIGIAKSTMSDYLNHRSKPGAGVLEKMAAIFGVTKADIDTTYKNVKAEIVDGELKLINDEKPKINKSNELVGMYLQKLERLERENSKSQVSEQPESYPAMKKIPIIGKIAAGTPIEAVQDIVDHISPPYDAKNVNELFGLVVNGESMNKIVPNGHYAILKKQPEVENGEIAAVIVNNNCATLKKVYKFTDLIVLEPCSHDPSFKDQQYSKENCDDIKIIGKYLYSVSPMFNN